MKRITLILAIILLCSLGSAHAYTNVAVSFGFHDTLSPYGSWINVGGTYGNVWRPHVAAGWRPFTYGHWIYTSAGPYWDGYEPYAWCVYHYGHWVWIDGYGWSWVPGYEYSAAPVSWAYGDGYIGWSPIYGYSGYDSNFWVFVDFNHFGYSNYSRVFMPAYRMRPLLARRAIRVVSRPLAVRDVERITGRRVQVVSTRERVVRVDGREARLVVPRNREQTVIRQIDRSAKGGNTKITEKTKTTIHSTSAKLKERGKSVEHKTMAKTKEFAHRTMAKTKGIEHRTMAKTKSTEHRTMAKTKGTEHRSMAKTKAFEHRTVAKGKTVEHKTMAKLKEKSHAAASTAHRTYARAENKLHAKNTGGSGGKGFTRTVKRHNSTKQKSKPY